MLHASIRPETQAVRTDPQKITDLVACLSLKEKASLCSGKNVWNTKPVKRLDIPSMLMTDGPHGVRKTSGLSNDNIGMSDSLPSTCFPTACALASTWNRGLVAEVGAALGEECLQEGVGILLGPGINIKRSPLCGRNFEYFSEDPFLTAELASSMVLGIQSKGIGACLKHFAVNNQEKYRMTIDAVVDERALHEIYLYPFSRVISQANPLSLMVSYNKVNGEYASESMRLIRDTLRKEWGYDGVVITDWGATNDRVLALQAGVDLEMPSSGLLHDPMIVRAVECGRLAQEDLDNSVRRNLSLAVHAETNKKPGFRYSVEEHHALAAKAAGESIVLLKNNSREGIFQVTTPLLPLQQTDKVALIGEFAKKPRYQGAGSSIVHPTRLENLYQFAAMDPGRDLSYAKGYHRYSDDVDQTLVDEAKELARNADVVVIMAGLPESYESEGFDRTHLKLPKSHNTLIQEIAGIHSNVVVVLANGAPVEMPWADKVSAIVESHLAGQACGSSLWDVLTGKLNPSGKITESFPLHLEDTGAYPYFPMGPREVDYRESIFVGYRFYEKIGRPVLFPFGHGLSYTAFSYSGFAAENARFDFSSKNAFRVSVTVENTGGCFGSETVQLYVRNPSATPVRPEKELKGFEKVALMPKEKRIVSFLLDPPAFSLYSTTHHRWSIIAGTYGILAGSSSSDIRAELCVEVVETANQHLRSEGKEHNRENQQDEPFSHQKEDAYLDSFLMHRQATRDEYYAFIGKPVPEERTDPSSYHCNSTIMDCQKHWICRLMYHVILFRIRRMAKGDRLHLEMMRAGLLELPLRGLALMSSGAFSYKHLDALILWMNQKRLKAIGTLLRRRIPGETDVWQTPKSAKRS